MKDHTNQLINNMSAESVPSESIDIETSTHPKDVEDDSFQWTAITILQSIAIFILAGLAEIMGGWLVWATIKGVRDSDGITVKKPWYYAFIGSLVLVLYGYIPCLQPSAAADGFGRIYAAYGGYFIVLSFLLAWALEGESAKPDIGDIVGGAISLLGVLLIMFWPR